MAFSDLIGQSGGTVTRGQRTHSTIGSDRAVLQYLDRMEYIHADVAPLLSLTRKLGSKKTVGNPTFKHLETDELPGAVEINNGAGYQDSATSIAVDTGDGSSVNPGTILLNTRSAELMRVTAVSTDTLTVTRGAGGTTAAAIVDNDELQIQGQAASDGYSANDSSNPLEGISNEPSFTTNCCQIFRQQFEATRRDLEAEVYGTNERLRNMTNAQRAMRQQMEKAYLFNPGISTTDPMITAGIPYWVTSNVTDMSGAVLDEQSLNTFIKKVMRRNQGENNCVTFVGENCCEAIDSWGRDAIEYRPDDSVLGIAAGAYKSSFGTLKLVKHGLLSDITGSGASYGRWGGYMFFLNMNFLGYAVMGKSGDMHLRQNIHEPGKDGEKHEWLTDQGLYVITEKRHGILKGAAAVEAG